MGKNSALEPQLHSDVPGSNFGNGKELIGAVLSFSENLRSKGQRQSSPRDQIWTNLQFWIRVSIQIYHIATSVNERD